MGAGELQAECCLPAKWAYLKRQSSSAWSSVVSKLDVLCHNLITTCKGTPAAIEFAGSSAMCIAED